MRDDIEVREMDGETEKHARFRTDFRQRMRDAGLDLRPDRPRVLVDVEIVATEDERGEPSIEISDIVAHRPGQGHGSTAMAIIAGVADDHDMSVTLETADWASLAGSEWIVDWYQRFGFEIVDDTDGVQMRRTPGEVPSLLARGAPKV